MARFFLRLPSEDRYFEIETGKGSPEVVTITEVYIAPTSVLESATLRNIPESGAPYVKELEEYISLVTSQYQNSDNYIEWLSTALRMLTFADNFTNELYYLFDIDDTMLAYVNQLGVLLLENGGALLQENEELIMIDDSPNPILDIIGVIVGQPRKLPFQPSNDVSPIMDDNTYLKVLRATIGKNSWDGNLDSLQPLWKSLFPGGQITVVDNQDMTMDVELSGGFSSLIVDLINNGYIIPRPQGVWYDLGLSTVPLFGWGYNNEYIGTWGYGTY